MLFDDREDLVCCGWVDRLREIIQPVESDMMLVATHYRIDMLSFESFFVFSENLLRIFIDQRGMHSTRIVETFEEC